MERKQSRTWTVGQPKATSPREYFICLYVRSHTAQRKSWMMMMVTVMMVVMMVMTVMMVMMMVMAMIIVVMMVMMGIVVIIILEHA